MRPIRRAVAALIAGLIGGLGPPPSPEADSPEVQRALDLNDRAVLYRKDGRAAEAEPLLRRSIAIREAASGLGDVEAARTRYNLANLLRSLGRPGEAAEEARRVAEVFVALPVPVEPEVAATMKALANLAIALGDRQVTLAMIDRLRVDAEARLGPDDPEVAHWLTELAAVLQEEAGREPEAEAALVRALRIRERHPDDPLRLARALEGLGVLHYTLGRYPEATTSLARALETFLRLEGESGPAVTRCLGEIAWLAKAIGRYVEAESLHRQVLEARVKADGDRSPQAAASRTGLAAVLEATGRFAEAEALDRRALADLEAASPPLPARVAQGLLNLAALLRAQGRVAEAGPLIRRALEVYEQRFGPDHPQVGKCLDTLAAVETATGQAAEAEAHLQRARRVLEAGRGADHPRVAACVIHQAELCRVVGRDGEAEARWREALRIRRDRLGPDHPDLAEARSGLALILAGAGRWAEAVELADQARRGLRGHAARTLPGLAEPDQLAFLKARDRPSFHAAMTIGLDRGDDPLVAEAAAGWAMNGKAATQSALAQQVLLAREATDPARLGLVARLAEVRNRIAVERLTPSGRPGELDRLRAEEGRLAEGLGLSSKGGLAAEPWVEPSAVRSRLARDEVLVEVVRVEPVDLSDRGPSRRSRPGRYAAWVVPPVGRGAVRRVDLGDAGEIERAVSLARSAMLPSLDVIPLQGEKEAEKLAKGPLRELSKRILDPLLPDIGESAHWLISPDSALWLVPWSALILPEGGYVVESHRVTLLVNGASLARVAGEPATSAAVVMAHPDYDLDPDEARAASARLLAGRPGATPKALALRGSSRPPSRLKRVEPLDGMALEAEAIQPLLRAYVGTSPVVYTDREALEPVFKALTRPRVLVLSTHGFTFDAEGAVGAGRGPSGGPGGGPENPLLRCGLMLAGCNRPASAASPALDDDDGILTGREVVATDLRGTELVVLSACQTALGAIRDGEGVAGLRQAFQLAGAEGVLATLWSVDDRESAQLMAAFFGHLARHLPASTALREAQLDRIRWRRRHLGGAHPFFWSAHAYTGPDPVARSSTATHPPARAVR